jgi:hypothetical protein
MSSQRDRVGRKGAHQPPTGLTNSTTSPNSHCGPHPQLKKWYPLTPAQRNVRIRNQSLKSNQINLPPTDTTRQIPLTNFSVAPSTSFFSNI